MAQETHKRKPLAFTLVELLVVVSITAFLLAFLSSATSSSIKQAKTVVVRANFQQLSTSIRLYATDWDDRLPYGQAFCDQPACTDSLPQIQYARANNIPYLKQLLGPYGYMEHMVIVPIGDGQSFYNLLGTSIEYTPVLSYNSLTDFEPACPLIIESEPWISLGKERQGQPSKTLLVDFGGSLAFKDTGEMYDKIDDCFQTTKILWRLGN